jgi:predicted amidohydrolase
MSWASASQNPRGTEAKADFVLFPELYLEGYRADERFSLIAEAIPIPSTERLTAVTSKHGLYIILGLARIEEHYPYLVYNSLRFVGPDGLVDEGNYDKIHPGIFHCNVVGWQKDFSFFGGSKFTSSLDQVATEGKIEEEDFVNDNFDVEQGIPLRRQWL